ncbi:MAG: EamA family transporter [Gemmatimonadota bacterium]|nr:MAG: EamA family transporter [Gemmatimonadota bacterium]
MSDRPATEEAAVSAARPVPADGDRLGLLAGFAAIYMIWGSTYLAIRFAVETLPPFLMTGVRFLMAGTLMYGWARLRGVGRPSRSHWAAAALVGTLMLLFGVGGVSWAEQWVPSGAAALIVAVGPLWMVLIDWLFFKGVRPGARVVAGILLGFAGVVLLVGPEELAGAGRIDLVGAGVILLGTVTWSFGSLYSRGPSLPSSPILATGMEMLMGAFVLLAVGTAAGEWAALDLAAVSLRSLLSVGYLAVFGSIIALSAYLWLLKVTTPARVITHAYVNPVVAVFLGWALADEPLNPRTLAAMAVITTGVLVIITRREVRRAPAAEFEHA